ncbi:MAG TPA: 30S ribosome-binding factor RbfA [Patescibacteria group bacterium]|nr:30S ribosome-binding factor RbfA [Patescibacteria group bacterium]
MAGHRMEQVDSLIHRHLSSSIARDIEFSRDALVTLTRVKTSADISVCKVWVSVIPVSYTQTAIDLLTRKARVLEHHLSHDIQLKKIPHVIFVEDVTGEQALEMEELLDTLKGARGGD